MLMFAAGIEFSVPSNRGWQCATNGPGFPTKSRYSKSYNTHTNSIVKDYCRETAQYIHTTQELYLLG